MKNERSYDYLFFVVNDIFIYLNRYGFGIFFLFLIFILEDCLSIDSLNNVLKYKFYKLRIGDICIRFYGDLLLVGFQENYVFQLRLVNKFFYLVWIYNLMDLVII